MKKVLALVLAVIMVCTMAMAVTVPNVDIANATLGTTSDKYGTVTLNASNIDKEGYAYVDLGTTIFSLLKGSTATTSDITAKTFKITVPLPLLFMVRMAALISEFLLLISPSMAKLSIPSAL